MRVSKLQAHGGEIFRSCVSRVSFSVDGCPRHVPGLESFRGHDPSHTLTFSQINERHKTTKNMNPARPKTPPESLHAQQPPHLVGPLHKFVLCSPRSESSDLWPLTSRRTHYFMNTHSCGSQGSSSARRWFRRMPHVVFQPVRDFPSVVCQYGLFRHLSCNSPECPLCPSQVLLTCPPLGIIFVLVIVGRDSEPRGIIQLKPDSSLSALRG